MSIYAISLLKPEISYFKNGILIDPNRLMINLNEELEEKKVTRRLALKENEKIDSDSEDSDGFTITNIKKHQDDHIEDTEDAFIVRPLPTGHFVRPSNSNKVFLKMQKGKTCFMMIKSHQSYDISVALKAGVWSSTTKGNETLQNAYEKFITEMGGSVYLFFSVNKSGHICALAELVSSKLDTVPDIWLEKQKYSGCFLVRFI
jgi:hypothetical protein